MAAITTVAELGKINDLYEREELDRPRVFQGGWPNDAEINAAEKVQYILYGSAASAMYFVNETACEIDEISMAEVADYIVLDGVCYCDSPSLASSWSQPRYTDFLK